MIRIALAALALTAGLAPSAPGAQATGFSVAASLGGGGAAGGSSSSAASGGIFAAELGGGGLVVSSWLPCSSLV